MPREPLMKLAKPERLRKLVRATVFSVPRCGKTRFLVTAPRVGVLPLDRNTRDTVYKDGVNDGKAVWLPERDYVRTPNAIDTGKLLERSAESKAYYGKIVAEARECLQEMIDNPGIATVGVDTGTALFELICMATVGKTVRIDPTDRTVPNQEMGEIMNAVMSKHLVVTHRASEVWEEVEEKGKIRRQPTGRFRPTGCSVLDYFCNVRVELGRVEDGDTFTVMDGDMRLEYGPGTYWGRISRCLPNPALSGVEAVMIDDDISFDTLAQRMWPDAKEEEWR